MEKFKRILIVGDSGRGKSTLAKKLSEKLKIRRYSTDDFFWKVKFTVAEEKSISINNISKIYNQESWIVEGSTRSLIKKGVEKSDKIIYLVYQNIFAQFWTLLKRHFSRKEEGWRDLLGLFKHLIFKRYKLGAQNKKADLDEILYPYFGKITKYTSFKEINNLVNNL